MFKLNRTIVMLLIIIVSMIIFAVTALADVNSLYSYISLIILVAALLFSVAIAESEEQ